ncbi:MAG: arylsulfatase [Eggerthellaceae bacterium]|nr:arylsulfatase [Eggerthellaceae bacterium]
MVQIDRKEGFGFIARRCVIAAYDAFSLLAVSAIIALGIPENAYAYVDPSVMTYTIQALAGVAVALGAVAGVAFRRTRRVLFNLLRIDENAGKTVERKVFRIAEGDVRAHAVADRQAKRMIASMTKTGQSELSWKSRFLFALIASGFFTFTFFVASPYELIGGGSDSLMFGLSETWRPFAVAGIIIWIALAVIISLLKGKAFNISVASVIGFGLLCYLQALFGNGSLPSADGAEVAWDNFSTTTIINGILWLLGIVALAIFLWKKPTLCRNALCVLAVCVAIVEAVGVGSLFLDPVVMAKSANDSEVHVTEDGLFDISDKENVVLFLLDWYDNATLNYLYDTNPNMLDEMTGFTYYKDVSGSIAPTRYAVPWILTAQMIQHDELYSHYLSTIYDRSTFLDDLKATGYSIGIYTDTFGATKAEVSRGIEYTSERAFNIKPIETIGLDVPAALLVMYKASCYRNLPWVAKPAFWFYTDQINQAMAQKNEPGTNPANTPYIMDDAGYYAKLKQTRLKINDDDTGSFRIIHLMGIHEPFNLDENGEALPEGTMSNEYRQGLGVMKMVSEYIHQLKELGVYEKTTIIISCDHGTWIWDEVPLAVPNSPIMLVKPAGAGDQDGPAKLSYAPISQYDLHASIMKAITGDGSKYGTAFDEVDEDAHRVRMYIHPTIDVPPDDTDFIEYEIDGYTLDFSNWHTTGKVWSCFE